MLHFIPGTELSLLHWNEPPSYMPLFIWMSLHPCDNVLDAFMNVNMCVWFPSAIHGRLICNIEFLGVILVAIGKNIKTPKTVKAYFYTMNYMVCCIHVVYYNSQITKSWLAHIQFIIIIIPVLVDYNQQVTYCFGDW